MQLGDVILASAQASLGLQRADGSFPPGHNGPYHDPETPVRNTGHWVITLCKAYEISGDIRLRDAAWRAAQYLISAEARPMQATFFCRKNPKKDFCNGLIGQAWALEALVSASETLGDGTYVKVAEEVFLMHPFDDQRGLWQRVNVEGTYSTFDMTLNHQLWFAAAGSMLSSDPQSTIGSQVMRCLHRTQISHLSVARSGRIAHHIRPFSKQLRLEKLLRSLRRPHWTLHESARLAHKEAGYHAFNLYAFALLKRRFPVRPLWRSKQVQAAWRYAQTEEFRRSLEDNEFGYPYNPPGLEMTFALEVFAEKAHTRQHEWLSEQLRRSYDFESHLMNRGTEDPLTLSARLYEATRLSEMTLRIGD